MANSSERIFDITRRSASSVRLGDSGFPVWCKRAVVRSCGFLVECLRSIALTLLLWFRPILFVVVRPLSGLLLIAFIICLFTHPADQRITWIFGLMTLGAFLVMHLYDSALMFLSRGNIVNVIN